jgi:membrane associated rhomboid family serine protease
LDQDKYTNGTFSDSVQMQPMAGPVQAAQRPSIVTVLIVVNVGIWFLQQQSPHWNGVIYGLGALQTAAVVHGEIWRLFTAQYLHAGFIHLLVNMIALHFLGRALEQLWSGRKFFAIYTACGLAGNLFFTILGAKGIINPWQAAVGASGCIYGLLGIVAVLFPRAEVLVYYVLPVKVRTAAIVMGAIAFMSVIERGANYGGEACHLAGLAFGVWWALHGDEWWSNSEWAWKRPRNPS